MNLTPAAILMLALAAIVGILAQWSDSVLAAIWWRAAVALVALGLVYELFVTRRLIVTAKWLDRPALRLGRTEHLELELKNWTQRKLAIEILPMLPAGMHADIETRVVDIAAGGAAITSVNARPTILGMPGWPDVPIRIKGPFKLAWWSRSVASDAHLRVQPDTLGARDAWVGTAQSGASAQAALGGGHELHHLREYRAGDAPRTIDWKATARTSRLITRVFSEQQHLEVMLLVDAGRTSRTEIDGMQLLGHYANLAARFAEYCVAGDDRVGLIAFADRPIATLAPARGIPAVTGIRHALAALMPRAVESDVLSAALDVRKLVRHRCLVLLLTDLYEPSATSQLAQSVRLLVPKHVPLIVGLMSEEVVELAHRAARDWLDPYRSLAAREYRRNVAANVARLGRLGAYAITARPVEADRRVLDSYRRLRAQRRV
jgi:uncharacterized protein (DUF58 family)